ncbi:glycosyltransferase family 2 protein [Roseivirga sp. E12]|uniref:glycosyltransferase family 2 protein n=1 Tax=Roseivirga sp. E12 TaxID=2819237 RepID=UPI001ABCAA1F|nr:glycosyltransferase family 2 protein [Roseivirga sp. E12]MBO3697985.1 glycosyltransferase family 2 protein [Roseivirga sp. E12]
MSTLSVVLLNFNGRHHLESFLPSVVKYSIPHEVVVVDNGSTDGSIEFIKTSFPQVKIIAFEKNLGFCGGYNKALQLIESEYVVLLNTDVEVTKNWIEPVLRQLQVDRNIKAAQPKILDQKAKEKFEYAGASGGYIDKLGYPFCRGRIFQTLEKDEEQYEDNRDIFWASGSCLFIHRETYVNLGGLDEDFFAHMEEIDLCWRIWSSGGRVMVVPQSKVYHVGGGTLDKSKPKKTYLNFRNGLSLLIKNERSNILIWKLPLRILLDWVALLKFSIESGPQHGLAILHAHAHVIFHIGSILKKRNTTNTNVNSPRYKGWVIWAYFIRGKKKFSDLKMKY